MARPRKKDAERLGLPIAVRLPEADRAALIEKAGAAGMTPAEYVRKAVASNATVLVVKKDRRDYDRLQYLVNKAGNNLNQLAHRAHVDHQAGTLSEATYARILLELQQLGRLMAATLRDA